MAIVQLKTRDQARDLAVRVNTLFGKKVMKQPSKRGISGWSPEFMKGGTMSLNRSAKRQAIAYVVTSPNDGSFINAWIKRSRNGGSSGCPCVVS